MKLRFALDRITLYWNAAHDTRLYNLHRGSVGPGAPFAYNHACLQDSAVERWTTDSDVPVPGGLFYYLVDAAHACGSSGLGEASAGPRPPGTSCPGFPGRDWDTDGRIDLSDVCPTVFDPAQPDADADRVGDACDNCPALFNSAQGDADRDGLGDLCQP